ncbi:unnamed protein product [Eruca vesicaria subsp. sativa]|uniref:RING-type E3 ubiquitin transferase n=1 Tax=Eruca vesicaria subsp. sativa TaxID=29727 RepID=A0ABC8IXN8_ERUVS|nr:unnamed protein product [Eruca vesicaria subsp. sativa]
MGTGWRRAFCTTAPRNSDAAAPDLDKQHAGYTPSPRSCVKLAFRSVGSNPSTPRLSSSPRLSCRTTDARTPALKTEQIPTPRSATKSPRLSLKARSNPSSPRSPLKLSLFRNSFKFRSNCGICLNSVKTGQGTAKYTAECSHAFHFPCITDYVGKHGKLVCPVCNSLWKDASLLTPHRKGTEPPLENIEEKRVVAVASSPTEKPRLKQSHSYDDDEPLLSPRFVTIPEADEETDVAQFKGFVVDPSPSFAVKSYEIPTKGRDFGNVQVSLLPESAIVSVGCGYETRAVALRVKAPPPLAARGRRHLDPSQRAPVDLVVVVDVGGTMNGAKLQMVKRAMRLVISSLSSADRLSIVTASSTTPKRLLPLKRMTENGKRSAGVVVDGLLCCQSSKISDGLEKAARVLEDRRERNPIASIVLLKDGQGISSRANTNQRSTITHVGLTRFAHIEIPVTEYGFGESGGCSSHPSVEDAFAKCIGGLLSVVVQDLRIQFRVGPGSGPCEIAAVYLCSGQPTLVSSGSGSVRLGDLYAGEERELLVELRIPSTASMAHQVLSARGLYKDPSTQEVVYGRDQSLRVPQAVRSFSPSTERLRSLFIMTRAVAESRRLVEYGECTSAHHLLTSAHALLGQSRTGEAAEYAKVVEAELVEVQWRRQQLIEYQSQHQQQHVQRRRGRERDTTMVLVDENGEPLTPASAWRAAEKLAKVAMMKKSDLHGFENARF